MATILLVDDDPLQAFVRKSFLEKRFSDVHRVPGAAEALCLIEQPAFADNLGLVISGHHLPGLSGPDFVAELHARMPFLPILVLDSGQDQPADYGYGQVSFFAQPIDTEEIVRQAERLLGRHKATAA
jgi:DNA-binding NtrC family response regulator